MAKRPRQRKQGEWNGPEPPWIDEECTKEGRRPETSKARNHVPKTRTNHMANGRRTVHASQSQGGKNDRRRNGM